MKAFDRVFFISAEPKRKTMKLLKVALQTQRYDVAAHALVFGLLSAKANGKKTVKVKARSPKGQPECQEARLLQPSSR